MKKILVVLGITLFTFYPWITAYAIAPGDVNTNLEAWFRADEEVYSDAGSTLATDTDGVQRWNDQSTNGYIMAEDTGSFQPTYRTSQINGQPVLDFDGTSEYMRMISFSDPGNTFELFIVAKSDVAAVGSLFSSAPGQPNTFRQYNSGTNGGGYMEQWPGDPIVALGVSAATTHVLDFNVTGGPPNTITYYKDGYLSATDSGGSSNIAWMEPSFGRIASLQFSGQYAEMIIYSDDISSSTDRSKIESYLALKYGLTLDQTSPKDYILSDASVAWDASVVGTTYDNGIAGLSKDTNSGLSITTSKSETADAVLTGIATSGTLENLQSFVWSHNGEGVGVWVQDETVAPYSRLQREWIIEENNGDVGTVTIRIQDADIPTVSDTLYLAVDSDGDFSSGANIYQMLDNGTYWDKSINLADSEYLALFSLGSGVSTTAIVNEALVMTMDNTSVSLQVDPSVNGGEDKSEGTILTVASNASAGYSIYGKLDDGSGNAQLVSGANSIASSTGENGFSYDATNNASSCSSPDGTKTFASSAAVLQNSSSQDVGYTEETDSYQHAVCYDLNVNYNTPAGVYTGTITYTVVASF